MSFVHKTVPFVLLREKRANSNTTINTVNIVIESLTKKIMFDISRSVPKSAVEYRPVKISVNTKDERQIFVMTVALIPYVLIQ